PPCVSRPGFTPQRAAVRFSTRFYATEGRRVLLDQVSSTEGRSVHLGEISLHREPQSASWPGFTPQKAAVCFSTRFYAIEGRRVLLDQVSSTEGRSVHLGEISLHREPQSASWPVFTPQKVAVCFSTRFYVTEGRSVLLGGGGIAEFNSLHVQPGDLSTGSMTLAFIVNDINRVFSYKIKHI
ncbi:hypothetical protein Bpfe_015672, partial [Biomphalaria pfeifferi]